AVSPRCGGTPRGDVCPVRRALGTAASRGEEEPCVLGGLPRSDPHARARGGRRGRGPHQSARRGGARRRAARGRRRSARTAARIDCAPMARHYLSVDDLTPAELTGLLELAAKVKADPAAYADRPHG